MSDKQKFLRELAKFLVGNQAEMSIRLGTGDAQARAWANLRDETPLFGYPTVEEAEAKLGRFLGIEPGETA